jgi:glycosyltransferase involved in cell wall biosynthesis
VFVISFVGRLLKAKGIEDLIRAFCLLPSDCFLAIVGDGEFRAEAELLAVSLGVNSRILWIPQVPSLDVPDYINLLDVLVLPSRTQPDWKEQFGRVLVEAMACEVPPVGSNSGEIPNVIADAGLTFPEGDVNALAAHLRCLYENAGLKVRLGTKGRSRVLEHYTHRRIAEQSLELYQEVLSAQNSTHREQILA